LKFKRAAGVGAPARKDTPMLKIVAEESTSEEQSSTLDEICREGARRMLAAALELEVDEYLAVCQDEVDDRGRRLVVRNGHARRRTITTVAGAVEMTAPRVNDRRVDVDTGERMRFTSALTEFFGSAAGLSPSVITRLTAQWQDEQRAFMGRDLSDRDFVYVWVDGVHFNVRLEEARLCCLVIVGVRLDGTKELVAIADGYRESTDSWADLLRDLKRRGMRPPVVAVGDGALGFWAALRDVWPQTREQRDWVHKVANTLDALPRSVQPTAKKMLAEIRDAEDRDHAAAAATRFDAEFRAKWPKAADKITGDLDRLLTFYDFPAEHWLHLKTSNPIESTFSTVRLRTKVTKGPGSRAAGLAMAFKLIESAQDRWRAVNGPHLVALVRAGATFRKGVLIENEPHDREVAA
jgi:putative transposase